MIIAIDFDGTCVTHEFPRVGKDVGAVPILQELVKKGHKLILFTMRSFSSGISPITNKEENGGLQDAIKWFDDNKIPLYGINTNPTQKHWTGSPKAYAELYIDDAALGCPLIHDDYSDRPYVDWKEIKCYLLDNKIL